MYFLSPFGFLHFAQFASGYSGQLIIIRRTRMEQRGTSVQENHFFYLTVGLKKTKAMQCNEAFKINYVLILF